MRCRCRDRLEVVVGTVATDERQTLEQELVQARAWVEGGECGEALDLLVRVRDRAFVHRDVQTLHQVWRLSGEVFTRACADSSDARRAVELGKQLSVDFQVLHSLGADTAETPDQAADWQPKGAVFAWIWIGVFVAAVIGLALFRDNDPATDDGLAYGMLAVGLGIALSLIYFIAGSLLHYLVAWARRRRGTAPTA